MEFHTDIESHIGPPIEVTDEIIQACREKGQFGSLLFDLYREAGGLLTVTSAAYVGYPGDAVKLERNQAICAGLREAASRGFFLASNAPFGYRRVKDRPTLEVDPATAPVVKEIFEKSLRGSGLKGISKELNDRGVTNRGKRWYKGTLHYLLRNEAYTGTAVWGRTSKREKTQEPVRVDRER